MSAPDSTLAKNAHLLFALRLTNDVMNASDTTLERSVSLCENIAVFFGGVIVSGVAVEIWLAINHFSVQSFKGYWGPVIADVLIAAGVGLEVLFGFRGTGLQSELTRRSNEKLAEAISRATAAESALIEFRKPRDEILVPRKDEFISKLRVFSETLFDFGLSDSNGEQADFTWVLGPILVEAGWAHRAWVPSLMNQAMVLQGPNFPRSAKVGASNVEIHLHPEKQEILLPAAEALISAFVDIGIAARYVGFNAHSNNPDAIHILIGEKR